MSPKDRLKAWRLEHDVRQKEAAAAAAKIAKRLGARFGQSTWHYIETGERLPSAKQAAALDALTRESPHHVRFDEWFSTKFRKEVA